MNDNLWAEFGKNINLVSNFRYFPEEWGYQKSDEKFVDFAGEYKKDFNSKEDFQSLYSLDSFDTDFTGFYKILKGEIRVGTEIHPADFVFLKNGKLKYSQKKLNNQPEITLANQIFYDGPFYLIKEYSSSANPQEEDLLNFDGDLNPSYTAIESVPRLLYVQREGKFLWKNGFSLRHSQWSLKNSSLFLYKKGNSYVFGEANLNPASITSLFYYLEEIKKNPYVFSDFKNFKRVFGNLEFDLHLPIFNSRNKRKMTLNSIFDNLKK